MNGVFVGIDVGGTHTDGVAVADCRILHKVKVPTTADLQECTLKALRDLLEGLRPAEVARVVLSTTLVTNTIVEGRLEPTGTLLSAGPGMDPRLFLFDNDSHLVQGAVDHRGREITAPDDAEIEGHLADLRGRGIRVLAVAGKFSVRNPGHEQRIAELAGDRFDYVACGHLLSGSLNFPRRAASTHLAAGVWRQQRDFVDQMSGALRGFGITAPLYLLRADGGTQIGASFRNPAETALSGPAASIMGGLAVDVSDDETLTLDVGGTTTDISVATGGAPLLEPQGATIDRYRTQIRALYTRSRGIGGDSWIRVESGELVIGPKRRGPPAAFGGEHPTPTDALVVLGRTMGDRDRALSALAPVAQELELSPEALARRVLQRTARSIAAAAAQFLEQVNSQPVYTIHELLEGHKVQPRRAVVVGGPARALAPYLEEALDLPVFVPEHFDVANAVGAALARVNLEVNLLADTAGGTLAIPECDVYRAIPRHFSLEEARKEATACLMELAREKGLLDPAAVPEAVEEESFRVIEGVSRVGSIHRIRMQIRPGILCRAVGASAPGGVFQ